MKTASDDLALKLVSDYLHEIGMKEIRGKSKVHLLKNKTKYILSFFLKSCYMNQYLFYCKQCKSLSVWIIYSRRLTGIKNTFIKIFNREFWDPVVECQMICYKR